MVLRKIGFKTTVIPYSRSKVSSEILRESSHSQKSSLFQPFSPSGLQKSSPAPSIALSHTTDFEQESELFTELPLAKMEKMFEEGVGLTRVLDMEVFLKAMKKIMSNVPDEILEAVFLKVDSDCDGFITWQKYVDYVMCEFRGKELMRKSQYCLRFHLPMRIVPLHHGCEIVKVQFLIQRFKKMGHFLTITKDGILEFWSESLRISSFRLKQIQQHHNQQMWVIDMVCLHNLNLIAVASTDQKIEFFDISNHKCERAFTFTDLDSCALVMDYWSDCHRGVFCFGDTKGNVMIFTSDSVIHGLFNPHILPRASKWERDHWIKVPVQKLLDEKSALHRSYRLKALHPNWCRQIKFIPHLNLVASCSATEKSSLVLTVLPSTPPGNLKSSALNLRRGVLCFDYLPDKNFLVTAGYDPIIRLWTPFFSKRPVWLLKGHQTSVMYILVNHKNYSILLSISKDKIGILKGYLEYQGPQKAGESTTHSAPLCAILYSKIFKQVVSGSLKGMVSVWEIVTGRRMMQFSVVNAQNVELTAMALDESERCLLTGLRDGTIKMWNYNIGDCLLTFPKHDQLEISGITHMNKVFYVTGWSRRITYFMFHKIKPVLLCHHCPTFHTEDVLSMAKYQNQFLGTSSYSGDILLWNINWLKPILNFNASKSPLPSQPKRVEETEGYLSSRCHMMEQKWAYKQPPQLSGPSARTVDNANLRRNLMSAPPVMRHSRGKESDRLWPKQKRLSAGSTRKPSMPYVRQSQSVPGEAERRKERARKKTMLQYSTASVEKIIFLQTRPRLPQTAALLSSCMDGYIYAWSIHGNGGLLGIFPVDLQDDGDVVVGAMATDKNDMILITGDCKGHIKIWDIKDYCILTNHQPTQTSGEKVISKTEDKAQVLIPKWLRSSLSEYIPLKEKKVMAGQTISLVPPKLLNSWKGHLDSVTDILFVDIFQLIVSAGQDQNVTAWKLSGDAVGTFGLTVWRRLQDPWRDGDDKQEATLEDKVDSKDAIKKALQPNFQEERDLAEVLAYQRREQVALMDLLYEKADKEAEAWAKVQKMALLSPWAGERSLKDIESSWLKWESKGKLVSKVLGAAYKYKERSRSPALLSTNVQYAWMKYQILPQIYQNLHFSDLKPTQQFDFSATHRVPEERVQRIHMVTHQVQKGLEGDREQAVPDVAASMPAAPSSPSSLPSLSASASRFLDSNSSTSPRLQSSSSSLRPWSASVIQFTPSVPSQTLRHRSGLVSSMKRGSHVKF
ncbi:EF-hand calcium-binding domain-containing protein 8 isoform X3 [Choloepus didactylus]|uniref:EF-hand calcium-binding domain-containing protein 8 isoform X3 n=1 Tax=Choloepus didactylus TaxID=27675 RepID=UPI00189FCE1C|nr:EF-hand calcium-binding domain-containing protein 8 isoform X3 [Choloepus didactylus]